MTNWKAGNPYAALVEDQVKTKVTQKPKTTPKPKPKPVPQPPQKSALELHQDQLWADAVKIVTSAPWKKPKGAHNTYFLQLETQVPSQSTTLWVHLTINKKHLSARCYAATIAETVADMFDGLKFHVTFEEYDDVPDEENPRWYNDPEKWVVEGDHVGLDKLAKAKDAVAEAKGIMAALSS
ncbi:MAG TPA: hypothetical protein VGG05_17710 [Pseudonocardiaceae bacterium]|jgi:hypothetical protein